MARSSIQAADGCSVGGVSPSSFDEADSMDALAQLALMTKAKLVFETTSTFLSFPALTPMAYPPESLNFSGPSADLQTLSDFSVFANLLPQGTLFQPSEESYLWDLYHDLFHRAQVAQGTATVTEAAYQQAMALLKVDAPDGLQTDSPALVKYNQYRDAWFAAMQEYKNAQVTADLSTDPAAKTRWETGDEPVLRQQVAAAEAAWSDAGGRAAIEAALNVQRTYEDETPALVWNRWSQSYNPDIDTMAFGDGPRFAPTGFSPSDVFDHGEWPTFTLASAEIAQLIATAPPELKAAFDPAGSSTDFDSISFEFRSVVLTRSWFHPEVFSARFWRLPPGDPPLSDGATPPTGRWPAYITAVVFARNIVVGRKQTGGGVQQTPVKSLPPIIFRRLTTEPTLARPLIHPLPESATPAAPPSPPPAAVPPPAVGPTLHLNPSAAIHLRAEMISPATMHINPGLSAALATRATPAPAPAPVASHLNLAAISRFRSSSFRMIDPIPIRPFPIHPTPPTPPATPPTPPPPPPVTHDVSVLAFICKRLPKCPDPDPSLVWPG